MQISIYILELGRSYTLYTFQPKMGEEMFSSKIDQNVIFLNYFQLKLCLCMMNS